MINLKDIKPNVPKANIEDYVFTIYGRPKSGKTTLFANLTKEFYGDVNKGLLLGFEAGYNALEVLAAPIHSWSDFVEAVDQLIEEKDELPYKFIGIDTADIAYQYATEYIIRKKKIEDSKPYKAIGDIPYGQGYDLTDKEMSRQFTRIQKAGYGLMFISHDNDKKFTSRDGVEYDKTTISLPNRPRNTVLNMSDFILFIDIAKEKDENDKLNDKRYIYFRADGSDLEAGSRFKNVPVKIEYDVNLFIKTFEDAVLSSLNESLVGIDNKIDVEKIKKEQKKEKEKKAEEFIEKEKVEISANSLIAEIGQTIKGLEADKKKEAGAIFEEMFGAPTKYKECEDVEALQEAIERLNALK